MRVKQTVTKIIPIFSIQRPSLYQAAHSTPSTHHPNHLNHTSTMFRTSLARIASPAGVRAFSSTPVRPLASITIIGHLADTPELQATSTGREILRYAVASNSGPRDNRQTSWFRITAFENEGPRRDFLQSLPKGTLVYVQGEAKMNTFENAEGKNITSLNVVQRDIQVLSRPRDSEDASEGHAAAAH